MSDEWYLMGSLPTFNGGFEETEFDEYATDGFNELLLNPAIGIKITIYNDTTFQEGFETEAIIQNVTTDNINNDDTRQILCRIGTLKAGQFVEYKNRRWLITTLPDDNKIYEKAIMEYCNHYLQWVNENGEIIGRYCIVNDGTKYSTGETDAGNMLILGDTRINVRIPRDEESLSMEKTTRFLISNNTKRPTAYRISKYDDVSDYFVTSGVINLICVEDLFIKDRDNAELMVADYYGKAPTYTLEILNIPSPFIVKIGENYNLEFSGTKNGEPVLETEIKFTSSNPKVATIDSQAIIHGVSIGNCKTTAMLGDKQVVIDLEVKEIAAPNTYFINLIDTDRDYKGEILFGDVKKLDVKMYNGSTELTDFVFNYELINAESVAEIIEVKNEINNNYIVVRAYQNEINITKIFTVRVWSEEHNVSNELSIKVIGY